MKKLKLSKHSKIILNIVAIALMATGPILMILPGPQVLSWFGLALFIYVNYDYLNKFIWFQKLNGKLNRWKIDRKFKKLNKLNKTIK